MQFPLDTGRDSLPEPDVSVVAGARDDYADHPTSALLVVEVSDTTLSYGRGEKAADYAAAGVTDYWIVNLSEHQVEVCRQPRPDPGSDWGWSYAVRAAFKGRQVVSPLACPAVAIQAVALLGERT